MDRMQSPGLAQRSVGADLSEFARAELEAFVALNRRQRPAAWARVEELQQLCRGELLSTTLGRERSTHLVDDVSFGQGQTPIEMR